MNKVVPIAAGEPRRVDALTRLDGLEDAFLGALKEIRAIKAELSKLSAASPSLERLMSAEDVAKRLGENSRWVYQQAKAKKIPSIRHR